MMHSTWSIIHIKHISSCIINIKIIKINITKMNKNNKYKNNLPSCEEGN